VKRIVLLVACLAIFAGLVLVGCGGETTTTTSVATGTSESTAVSTTASTAASTETSVPASGEPIVIKLKFASEKPPTHVDMTDNFPGYFAMVEKATNGKYKIEVEYFPVGTILAPADIYDGTVNKIVDVGQSSMAYTPKRFPTILTLSQPGIAPPNSTTAMAKAANELYAKYKPKELADTHVLYLYASGPGWLHTKSKIETVDQLKGMKIRVSGTGVRGVQLIGGDPIAMPMADVFEAAQKGTIDALISPNETLEGWKHAELFDYSVFVPYLYASDIFFVTMNQAVWDALPEDLKAAFDSVAVEAGIRAGSIWDYASNHGMEFAKAKGHQFSELSDAERTKLAGILTPVRAEYVKSLNDLGLPGEEIATAAASLVGEANKIQFDAWQPAAK
jgi:TRAP-type C4-dicarboxylate transport system substrate-binding protein